MYLEIKPINVNGINKDFSYIIYKNPNNVYEKNLSKCRKVTGKFKEDKQTYQVYVENDTANFLKIARQLNLPNYVHTQLSAVCPYNLAGISDVFRSAIKGYYNNSGLSCEAFFKKIELKITVGPYPIFDEKIKEIFNDLNISLKTIYFKEILDKNFNNACMLELETMIPMSVTEFLQKIYIILYYGTIRYNLGKIEEQNIKKFVSLSENWLNKSLYRNNIINTLCRRSKELIKEFETSIENEENDKDLSFLERKSLHTKRHDILKNTILSISELKSLDKISLIDFGCGKGQFIKKLTSFKKFNILGIEAKAYKLKYKFKRSNVKLVNSNILYPNISEKDLLPDVLVCSEVIEHLTKNSRKELIKVIKDFIKPKYLMLTAPNFEYNEKFGLINEYRHRDHKIEYTTETFQEEVVDQLSEKYSIEYLSLLPEEDVQPSFMIFGKIKEDRSINKHRVNYIKDLYSNIYLEAANYEIRSNEISNGLASKQMMLSNIFYLAPTIAPVEYSYDVPEFLEHPKTAFKYFQERGVDKIAAEHKYMGSRAYILAFREKKMADLMGYKPITINSRQGYPFFNEEDKLNEIWEALKDKMNTDFIMLDCEIMPWVLKAHSLVERSFLIPGQCSYLSRYYTKSPLLHNSTKFIESLRKFIKEDKFSIKMFQLLAMGDIKIGYKQNNLTNYKSYKQNNFTNYKNGLLMNREKAYKILKELENDIFKCAKHSIIDLNSKEDKDNIIRDWENYCSEDGEGFVFKPLNLTYLPNGYYLQPALKVRGMDYLRLIYGVDYLEKDIFEKISKRVIKNKRALAAKQFEMSLKILRVFLNCNVKELKRYVAGFIGMENRISPNIDATL